MTTLFSRRCEYALQAVLLVAHRKDHGPTTLKELAGALDIPYHFLAKILQDLSRKGLLASHKGPQGGFALGQPAQNITLFDVVEAIDGSSFSTNCVLGFHQCSDHDPCALHDHWEGLREGILRMLSSRNLAELEGKMQKPGFVDKADRKSDA